MAVIDFIKDNATKYLPQKKQPGLAIPMSSASGGIGVGVASFDDEVRLPPSNGCGFVSAHGGSDNTIAATIEAGNCVLRASDILQLPRHVLLRVSRVVPEIQWDRNLYVVLLSLYMLCLLTADRLFA